MVSRCSRAVCGSLRKIEATADTSRFSTAANKLFDVVVVAVVVVVVVVVVDDDDDDDDDVDDDIIVAV